MPASPADSFQNVGWQDAGTGAGLNFDEYPSPRTMFSSLPQYESHEQQAVNDAAMKREPPASTLVVQTAGAQHDAGDIVWKDINWGSPVAPANPVAGPSQQFNYASGGSNNNYYQSGMFSDAGQDAFAASLGLVQHNQELGQDAFDDFSSSVYPPLDAPAKPMPYHHLPNSTQQYGNPVTNSYNVSMTDSFDSNDVSVMKTGGTGRSNATGYQGTSNPALTTAKVKLNRAAKKRGDPSCDPSTCYSSNTGVPLPWGSVTWYGQFLFTYTHKAQWLLDRCFETQQLREFANNCHQETVFWVQQTPTQCNHRLDPEDRVCRWAGCPVPNRSITAGWLRVAFDEAPSLTTNGAKDPLKYSGSVHLWCFEQIFDPVELHVSGRLRPEDRTFPNEDKSVVTLEKLTDAGIIRDAYLPWFSERMGHYENETHGPAKLPRPYEESLSYRLTKYHLDNQSAARQKARSRRNESKADDERRTIDVHRGDLGLFVNVTKKAKRAKKRKKLKEVGIDGGHEHGGQQPRPSIGRRPQSRDVSSYGSTTISISGQARAQLFNSHNLHNLHPRRGSTTINKGSNLKSPLSPARGGRVQNQPHMRPGPRWNLVGSSQHTQQGLSSRASGKQPVYYYHRSGPGQVHVQRRGNGQQTLGPSALPRQPPYFGINTLSPAQAQGNAYQNQLSIGPKTGQIKYENLWGDRGQSYIDDLDFANIYDSTNDAEDAMNFVLGGTDCMNSDAGQRQAEQTRSSPGTKRSSSRDDDDEEEMDENKRRRKDIKQDVG